MTSDIYKESKEIEFTLYKLSSKYQTELYNDFSNGTPNDSLHYTNSFSKEVKKNNALTVFDKYKDDDMFTYYENLYNRMIEYYREEIKNMFNYHDCS